MLRSSLVSGGLLDAAGVRSRIQISGTVRGTRVPDPFVCDLHWIA
jgi:hypothetical protein